jgi:hypothetical protein
MASSWLISDLFTALEKTFGRIVEENHARIADVAMKLADPVLSSLLTTLANHTPSGGIKTFEWAPVKGDILASIPDLTEEMNQGIEDFFATLPTELPQ